MDSLHFKIFKQYPKLRYGISTVEDGSMVSISESSSYDIPNRTTFFNKQKISPISVVYANLSHGTTVAIIKNKYERQPTIKCDGLLTTLSDVYLSITVADCFPVYIFNPAVYSVGIIHAGWRGIAKGIVKKAIESLKSTHADISSYLVGLGPGIHACHFCMTPRDAKPFKNTPYIIDSSASQWHIDLSAAIKDQFIDAGIPQNNIEDSKICTYCTPSCFSFRRDNNRNLRTMLAYIGYMN
ncbi:MAG: polyphenol oxidase family protein [Patescibacteria group bacterium]|nr:polyphenol oxidase family protein [Patescibacteria group bacterium]MDD5715094.1 polyphenol oxidase family protein [Patescibacteria group bacterium]